MVTISILLTWAMRFCLNSFLYLFFYNADNRLTYYRMSINHPLPILIPTLIILVRWMRVMEFSPGAVLNTPELLNTPGLLWIKRRSPSPPSCPLLYANLVRDPPPIIDWIIFLLLFHLSFICVWHLIYFLRFTYSFNPLIWITS